LATRSRRCSLRSIFLANIHHKSSPVRPRRRCSTGGWQTGSSRTCRAPWGSPLHTSSRQNEPFFYSGVLMLLTADSDLASLLERSRVIAVVGMSPNEERASHYVAQYMREHGYTIIPVNPLHDEIAGMRC